jgi:hypothetical protein
MVTAQYIEVSISTDFIGMQGSSLKNNTKLFDFTDVAWHRSLFTGTQTRGHVV